MANYNSPLTSSFARAVKTPRITSQATVSPGKLVTPRRYKFPVGPESATAPTTGQIWPRGR